MLKQGFVDQPVTSLIVSSLILIDKFWKAMLQTFGTTIHAGQLAWVPRMVDIIASNTRSLSEIEARNLACRQFSDNKDTLLNAASLPDHPNYVYICVRV